MSNRYSALNRRPGAATSSLFADYPGSRPSSSTSQNRSSSPYYTSSPQLGGGGSGISTPTHLQQQANSNPSFSSYPTSPNNHSSNTNTTNQKTSNLNSSYTSTAVLDHLEAQNESTQTSILSSKVSQLKQLSIAIGDEIRDSSSLAQTINDSFENTSVRLKGTMRRMLRMADRTGVGWRVWLGFFAAVWLIFVYVWLF